MSFWLTRKDESGKRQHFLVEVDLSLPLLLIVLVGFAAFSNPSAFALLSVLIMIAGLACIVVAKISLFRSGNWSSWGTASMIPANARWYRAGYALAGIGLALFVCAKLLAR
jgi:hypothetical protein